MGLRFFEDYIVGSDELAYINYLIEQFDNFRLATLSKLTAEAKTYFYDDIIGLPQLSFYREFCLFNKRHIPFYRFIYEGQNFNQLSDEQLLNFLRAIELILYSLAFEVSNENEVVKLLEFAKLLKAKLEYMGHADEITLGEISGIFEGFENDWSYIKKFEFHFENEIQITEFLYEIYFRYKKLHVDFFRGLIEVGGSLNKYNFIFKKIY